MDGIEGIANDGRKQAASAFATINGDEYLFIFGVGFDAGDVVCVGAFGVGEHDAAAPVCAGCGYGCG